MHKPVQIYSKLIIEKSNHNNKQQGLPENNSIVCAWIGKSKDQPLSLRLNHGTFKYMDKDNNI